MIGPDTIILDSYPAIEETRGQDIVLIAIYEGTLPVGVDAVHTLL
jgi:hypothetical protein